MRCDACSSKIKYDQTYIYKLPEVINYCLECADKYIELEDIKTDKNWRLSVFNKD